MAEDPKAASVRGDLSTAVENAATGSNEESNSSSQSNPPSAENHSLEIKDAQTAKEPSVRSKRNSGRRSVPNATELRFVKVHGRSNLARVQLLLCNISDRPIFWKLKASNSDISALPSGQGHLAAHASSRCVLSWHRAAHVAKWEEAAKPKLLLVTRFLNAQNEHTDDVTSVRLLAYVAPTGSCPATNPPVEQLLLDAVSKPKEEGGEQNDEMSIRKAMSPEKIEQQKLSPLTEFIVGLTPQQLWILLLCFAVLLMGVYNNTTRSRH
ncbi:hypothetical protein M3Y99_01147300 [Aphelenchoides fujianensis]|nr:hypothetical protein M3Y99_01147300 [Aphelenchoides fujianensis]